MKIIRLPKKDDKNSIFFACIKESDASNKSCGYIEITPCSLLLLNRSTPTYELKVHMHKCKECETDLYKSIREHPEISKIGHLIEGIDKTDEDKIKHHIRLGFTDSFVSTKEKVYYSLQ